MIKPGQLRRWLGSSYDERLPGYSSGACFLVLGVTPSGSPSSKVWRILISTGEISMFDTGFLEEKSEEVHT